MVITTYSFTISTDMPGGKVNTITLVNEIGKSSITIAVDAINTDGDTLDIVMKDALSTAEETTLHGDITGPAGGLLASHDNSDTIIDIETVKVQEEDNTVTTDGGFQETTTGFGITGGTGAETDHTICWPFDISALELQFNTEEVHRGDFVSLVIGENTIVGTITSDISTASAWTSQNYTVGQIVTYDAGAPYNTRVYTCTTNTVSNEIPTNKTYWQHGYEVPVGQTVVDNIYKGYEIRLDDGTNNDYCDRVLKVDSTNLKIYLETDPTNSYNASTPTYVKASVLMLRNHEISTPWRVIVGESKIGGSGVKADTTITTRYTNMDGVENKRLVPSVEYMQ